MSEGNQTRVGANVSVGLFDGRMVDGCLARFSPQLTVLPLDPRTGVDPLKERRGQMRLPIADVAYLGFLVQPGEPSLRPAELRRLKIHVAAGKMFLVDAVMPADGSLLSSSGFFAFPVHHPTPFREMFFYRHGVTRVEQPELLGTLLVAAGAATAADVERGMDAQRSRIGGILVEQERVAPDAIEAAAATQARRRLRLGEILVAEGLATPRDIELALVEQRRRKSRKIGEILVDMKVVTEQQVAETLARKFNLPFVDLDRIRINPQALNEVPRDLVDRYGFLPIDTDEHSLTIAISDPLNTGIDDVFCFYLSKKKVREVLAAPSQLQRAIERVTEQAGVVVEDGGVDAIVQAMIVEAQAEEAPPEETVQLREAESSIIRLANKIIIDGVRRGASDIHIEPNGQEEPTVVRFRIDGECVAYQEIPAPFRGPLVARLKIMASLDIAERRKPQDGKIRLQLPDRRIELRVATMPTMNDNEDVVLRILAASKPQPLDKMGLAPGNLTRLREALKQPYGLILCVGPTGSGKTTTLHSMLGTLNTIDMKIWTAEDPVEISQRGLRQVQVQRKIGLDFAAAMRGFLRADPDVIMVGEMRDHETAGTAIEASLTGHLVLSTLHTNSAPETITRLLDMGLDPFGFADALIAILAQRLARRLCTVCRDHRVATPEERAEVMRTYGEEALAERGIDIGPTLELWAAVGCPSCGGSGYKGRLGLHELLIADAEIKALVQRRAPVAEIRRTAMKSGMTTLLQDGIEKALAGETDLKQVVAVATR